ncbi:MAG: DNA cytosine methyltransferase [Atopobiaceae bacterium]|nr:DNA cytosine methyltransferase [Atopobiaceae bacterium]
MRYVSLFSGVEAATLAWEPLGWEPIAFCEIDEFPSAVLQHHWPDVPNLGDITKVEWGDLDLGAVDLVVGGSPCQSFSVAGGREGLDGESRLMWEYIRAVREIRPEWLLWENVPGVLSIDSGRAFGILLDELAALGYSLAWRVLDAQFFGVAQRRQRLFLVGGATGGGAAAVLFDSESLQGNPNASKEKRQALASGAGASAAGGSFALRDRAGRPGGG